MGQLLKATFKEELKSNGTRYAYFIPHEDSIELQINTWNLYLENLFYYNTLVMETAINKYKYMSKILIIIICILLYIIFKLI